ncbi:hypothetical protein FA95DRAFT_121564 [Auriscalpium vulgare]|uniref:Uncharacterized protein n=1 Tax=Auriscalpium vulgare TaxID=40419 RepID=A0ACB8RPR0_9AGAM|nr:hypothetical protein FA95DRAFT_121564 [Auriscalpium vulgare]
MRDFSPRSCGQRTQYRQPPSGRTAAAANRHPRTGTQRRLPRRTSCCRGSNPSTPESTLLMNNFSPVLPTNSTLLPSKLPPPVLRSPPPLTKSP